MFQKLSCLPYVFGSVLACAWSVQMFQKLSCLPYVFGSVLACAWSVQMFQKLSCLPYVFGSVLACAKSAHMHDGITLWAYLSQMHRPIVLHCMHYGITLGIPFRTCRKRQSQTSKFRRKNHNTTCSKSRDHNYRYLHLQRGIRKHCTSRIWLT